MAILCQKSRRLRARNPPAGIVIFPEGLIPAVKIKIKSADFEISQIEKLTPDYSNTKYDDTKYEFISLNNI